MRAFLLVCSQILSSCILTRWRDHLFRVSSYKGTNREGSIPSSGPNYPPEVPLGIRALIYGGGDTNIQSIACANLNVTKCHNVWSRQ